MYAGEGGVLHPGGPVNLGSSVSWMRMSVVKENGSAEGEQVVLLP